MQYIMYVRIALLVLGFVKDIRERKASGDADFEITAVVSLLAKLGEGLGIKGLSATELTEIAPMIKEVVSLVKELRKDA